MLDLMNHKLNTLLIKDFAFGIKCIFNCMNKKLFLILLKHHCVDELPLCFIDFKNVSTGGYVAIAKVKE